MVAQLVRERLACRGGELGDGEGVIKELLRKSAQQPSKEGVRVIDLYMLGLIEYPAGRAVGIEIPVEERVCGRRRKMNRYLEAIGFKNIRKREQLEDLSREVILHFDTRRVYVNEQGAIVGTFIKEYGQNLGLVVTGEFDQKENFH